LLSAAIGAEYADGNVNVLLLDQAHSAGAQMYVENIEVDDALSGGSK
jgi:hypothetical protein